MDLFPREVQKPPKSFTFAVGRCAGADAYVGGILSFGAKRNF